MSIDHGRCRCFGGNKSLGILIACTAAVLLLTACNAPGGGPAGGGGGAPLFGGGDEPPADADVWSIRCVTLQGPERFKIAQHYVEALKKVSGLKAERVSVLDEDGVSSVYYGRYARIYDQQGGKERYQPDPSNDLKLLRTLSVRVRDPALGQQDVWPFRLATMVMLPTGEGRYPQWQLTNAPGVWSVQVAVFYNSGGMDRRKYAAEEYCRLLREQGEEAYYHHGGVNSSVCIGAFPKESIQTFQKENSLTGVTEFSNRIVDQRILDVQKKHPHNLHNGAIFYEMVPDPKTGEKKRDPHTSFTVQIPKKKASKFGG